MERDSNKIILKKAKIFLFSFILTFAFAAVSVSANEPDSLVFELDPLVFDASTSYGYDSKALTSNAEYFFSGGTEEENTELARSAEIIIATARNLYGMEPLTTQSRSSVRVYFSESNDMAEVNISGLRVTINPADENRHGAVMFLMSKGKLPAWLCAGLELYWLDRYGIEGLEIDKEINISEWADAAAGEGLPWLGDEWFVPGLIESDLAAKAPSAAYAFVKLLEENGKLAEFVALYLDGEKNPEAEAASSAALPFRYLYSFRYLSMEDASFRIYGVHGEYNFMGTGWGLEKVVNYVNFMEDGIKYVKDWFNYDYDTPLFVTLSLEPHRQRPGIGGYGGLIMRGRYGFCLFNRDIYSIADSIHEAVHALNYAMGELSTGFAYYSRSFLIEGLASAVTYQFIDGNALCADEFVNTFIPQVVASDGERGFGLTDLPDIYEKLAGRAYTEEPFDFRLYLDAYATCALNDAAADENFVSFHDSYDYMNNYQTSESFVLYLLNYRGTSEDFRKIYADMSLVKEVYGVELSELIGDWLDYLGIENER